MSAPVSLCVARAVGRHAAASRRADAAFALGDAEVDAAAADELAATDALRAALDGMASADDVAAVIGHAYHQGARAAEPGAQVAVLLMLVTALAWRAFGAPLAA